MFCFKQHRYVGVVFAMIVLAASFIGCSKEKFPSSWGKRLEYKGSELFYTSAVGENEANKLGDYLLENGFFQENIWRI